jgi:hypothetical protein
LHLWNESHDGWKLIGTKGSETDMFDMIQSGNRYETQYTPTLDTCYRKRQPTVRQPNQAKQLGYLKQDIDMSTRKDITQNEFDTYMNRNKTNFDSEGGGMSANILPYQLPGEEEVPEDTGPEYRFGDPNAGVAKDVRQGTYNFNQGGRARRAEGGIMELRARRAFGGIMDRVTGRKAYGLGSIFKSVKNAASKVLSSDIGKMAIAGAAIYYGGGGANMFKSGKSNSLVTRLDRFRFMTNLGMGGSLFQVQEWDKPFLLKKGC